MPGKEKGAHTTILPVADHCMGLCILTSVLVCEISISC